jgi:hypothetical protein
VAEHGTLLRADLTQTRNASAFARVVDVPPLVVIADLEQLDEQRPVVAYRVPEVSVDALALAARAMPFAVRYRSTSSGCSTEMSAARCSKSSTG